MYVSYVKVYIYIYIIYLMQIYTCYYNYYKIPRTKHTRTLNSYMLEKINNLYLKYK